MTLSEELSYKAKLRAMSSEELCAHYAIMREEIYTFHTAKQVGNIDKQVRSPGRVAITGRRDYE